MFHVIRYIARCDRCPHFLAMSRHIDTAEEVFVAGRTDVGLLWVILSRMCLAWTWGHVWMSEGCVFAVWIWSEMSSNGLVFISFHFISQYYGVQVSGDTTQWMQGERYHFYRPILLFGSLGFLVLYGKHETWILLSIPDFELTVHVKWIFFP